MIKFHIKNFGDEGKKKLKKIEEINKRNLINKINEKFNTCIENIEKHWDMITQMRWFMKSDMIITDENMIERMQQIDEDSNYRLICKSYQHLIRYTSNRYVLFRQLNINELVQIISLGKDLTHSAGTSVHFLEYVKKEIQDVDLSKYLIIGF